METFEVDITNKKGESPAGAIRTMSSAGHIFDMIARMKANASRKKVPFDRTVDVENRKLDPSLLREATDEEMNAVRRTVRKTQQREQRINRIMIAFMALTVLVVSVYLWLLAP